MTQYVRSKCTVEVSDSPDYANARTHEVEQEYNVEASICSLVATITDAGEAINVYALLPDATNLLIENLDDALSLSAEFATNQVAGQEIVVGPGEWFKLCDFDPLVEISLVSLTAGTDLAVKLTVW